MATGCDTKATQTEEDDKEGYTHLTAKDINFKCPEGMDATLEALKVVNNKTFTARLELDGKVYSGWFMEATDSFAPENQKPFKKHRSTGYKKIIKRFSNAKRAKKPNVYSRANNPKGYVDTHNTIEARLRYGRDKRTPGSSISPTVGNSHSKDRRVLSKNNRKVKLQRSEGAVNSASFEDSPFREHMHKKKCRNLKGRKSTKYDAVTEATTSNENSTPSCMRSTSDNNENTPEHDLMTFSPELDIDSGWKNTVDAVESAASSEVSRYQLPELDLMTFSPRINTEMHCKNNDDAVQSAAWSQVSRYQLPAPDFMTFSPRINTETYCKNNDNAVQKAAWSQIYSWSQIYCKNDGDAVKSASSNPGPQNLYPGSNPSVNQRINDASGDIIDCSDAKRASSSTAVSLQKPPKKLDHRLRKSDDTQCIDGSSILSARLKQRYFNQLPESNLRSTPRREDLSVSDYTSVKITSDEVFFCSPESKPQHNQRNIDEIQSRHDLNRFETPALSRVRFRQSEIKSCPGMYEEMQGIRPDIDLKPTARQSCNHRSKSHINVDTRGIIEKSNEQRSPGEISNLSFESIQRNSPKKGRIRTQSDKTVKYTERKVASPKILSELNHPMNNEMRCTNDGTDLQTIASREFSFQKHPEHETSYRSGKKETELNIGGKFNAQSPISSEHSAHQRPKCRLKFSKGDVTQLGDDSNVKTEVAVADPCYQSSEYKPQPSFKESECTLPVIEDSNASFVQSSTLLYTRSEMPGKTEEMSFVSEVALIPDSVQPELRHDSGKIKDKECVNSDVEKETSGDILHHIMKMCDILEKEGKE